MINFTPPIKAALFISFIYLLFFQFFMHSANHAWLYAGNIIYAACSVLYIRFLNARLGAKANMLLLSGKGIKFSFISSLVSFSGVTIIFLLNNVLFSGTGISFIVVKDVKKAISIVFANSFLSNFVLGSLGAFFMAGLMNEKKYQSNTRALSSIKNYK